MERGKGHDSETWFGAVNRMIPATSTVQKKKGRKGCEFGKGWVVGFIREYSEKTEFVTLSKSNEHLILNLGKGGEYAHGRRD